MQENKEPLVVTNSSVEFVLAGPSGGRDRIVVRSERASLDLVALAAEPRLGRRYWFLGPGFVRRLNVIESQRAKDLIPGSDDRKSSYRFAWAGRCSISSRDKIKKSLDSALSDLQSAIRRGDKTDVEFDIAPLILMCWRANRRVLWLYVAFLFYLIFGTLTIRPILTMWLDKYGS